MNEHLAFDKRHAYDILTMRSLPKTAHTAQEKHDFLSSIGHELRNPLTTIIAQVEILLEGVHGPLEKAQKAALASIQDNTREMLHLITDAVDLFKIEAAPLPLLPAACSLADACDQSILQTQDLARSRSIAISREIQGGASSVMSDPRRLRQMLTELLSAAILASPAGGRVLLSLAHDDLGLHVKTCLLPAIAGSHSPFIPAKEAGVRTPLLNRLEKIKPIGTMLLQQLVRLHAGTFTIDESAGQPVSLSVYLPLKILPAADEPEPAAQPVEPLPPRGIAPPSREKPIILVADDQHALVTVVSTYFESLGFQVITAQDGREAVDLASKHHPDLIMMDVRMPVMDGLKALREIRSSDDPQLRDVVIISLSGIVGATDKDECLGAGATAYLNKPFGIRELDNLVRDYLGAANAHPEAVS